MLEHSECEIPLLNDNIREVQRILDRFEMRCPKHFGEITKGKWHFKIGRTTGLTTGVCHGAEVEVQRAGQVRWRESGNEVVLGKDSTSELVIMAKSKAAFEGNSESFSKSGDSGSFVTNSLGEVCGLLYGSLSGYVGPRDRRRLYINAGLVTSMDEVLESIKAKTGGNNSLPRPHCSEELSNAPISETGSS